jgi:hypothetical protein
MTRESGYQPKVAVDTIATGWDEGDTGRGQGSRRRILRGRANLRAFLRHDGKRYAHGLGGLSFDHQGRRRSPAKTSPAQQSSIAITPASGRSYMLLSAAYQGLGQTAEAKWRCTRALRCDRVRT